MGSTLTNPSSLTLSWRRSSCLVSPDGVEAKGGPHRRRCSQRRPLIWSAVLVYWEWLRARSRRNISRSMLRAGLRGGVVGIGAAVAYEDNSKASRLGCQLRLRLTEVGGVA